MSFVLTNLPAIYPLIKGAVDKTKLSYGSRSIGNITGGADKSTGNGYRLDSYPKGSRAQKHKGTNSVTKPKIQHPWDSEEKIVDPAMKSPASVGLEDRSSQEEIGSFVGDFRGADTKSPAVAARAVRGDFPLQSFGQPGEGNGNPAARAYELRVSEAQARMNQHNDPRDRY